MDFICMCVFYRPEAYFVPLQSHFSSIVFKYMKTDCTSESGLKVDEKMISIFHV